MKCKKEGERERDGQTRLTLNTRQSPGSEDPEEHNNKKGTAKKGKQKQQQQKQNRRNKKDGKVGGRDEKWRVDTKK